MKPLHQQIRDDIERLIRSGALQPGQRIPFEHELMAQYGVSRMTVNKALSEFAHRGWLRIEGRSVLLLDVERMARRAK